MSLETALVFFDSRSVNHLSTRLLNKTKRVNFEKMKGFQELCNKQLLVLNKVLVDNQLFTGLLSFEFKKFTKIRKWFLSNSHVYIFSPSARSSFPFN